MAGKLCLYYYMSISEFNFVQIKKKLSGLYKKFAYGYDYFETM